MRPGYRARAERDILSLIHAGPINHYRIKGECESEINVIGFDAVI